MLSTIISWTGVFDLEHRVRLDVSRISGGAIADYRALLTDEAQERDLASAQLKRYPRWSEPVTGFVARALHYCISNGTPEGLVCAWPVRTVQVRIALVPGGRGEPHELARLTADFRQMRAPVMYADEERGGVWERRDVRIGSEDALRLALHCLSQWTWDSAMPSGLPEPLNVPVRRAGEVAYVRMKDIPHPARTAFGRFLLGATVPAVVGEPDIAYASDWQTFLDGRR